MWAVSDKQDRHLARDPAVALLGIYSREMEICVHTETDTRESPGGPVVRIPRFHCPRARVQSLVGELKSQKPCSLAKKKALYTCPTTDEWVNQMWSIHTLKCYSAINRNEVLIAATPWMNLENVK